MKVGGLVSLISLSGSKQRGQCVLWAAVDIDAGDCQPDKTATAAQRDPQALAWVRAELSDGPLLACLRRRFRIDKQLPVDRPASRTAAFDWKRWEPGGRVKWHEIFPDSVPAEPYIVAGRSLAVSDWYCANPKCDCLDILLWVHDAEAAGKRPLLGELTLDLRTKTVRPSSPSKETEPMLAEVWAQIAARYDIERHFQRRRMAIQAAATEWVQRSKASLGSPSPASKKSGVPRNAPCPCGSGLKYKKCCLGKSEAGA